MNAALLLISRGIEKINSGEVIDEGKYLEEVRIPIKLVVGMKKKRKVGCCLL